MSSFLEIYTDDITGRTDD